jgi:predicted transglutaminase-like protease
MEFTEEQIKIIEDLAGLNYMIRQVAMYLDLPVEDIYAEYQDPDSRFRYHYDRGQLFNKAVVGQKLLNDAKAGNLTASALFTKAAKQNRINNLKHELFNI